MLPHPIEGLDTVQGLKRCVGKVDFYRHMLVRFARLQGDAAQRIGEAVAAQRWQEAQRLAHTLKGVAGNLGAVQVQNTADTLEHALYDTKADGQPARLDAPLQALTGAMASLLAQLNPMLAPWQTDPAPAASTATPAFSPDHLHAVCTELHNRLQTGDVSAAEWADTHQPELRQALAQAHAALHTAMANFDFDAASALLTTALTRLPAPDTPQ